MRESFFWLELRKPNDKPDFLFRDVFEPDFVDLVVEANDSSAIELLSKDSMAKLTKYIYTQIQ